MQFNIDKEDVAALLAAIDGSIIQSFPVTDDTETWYNKMLETVSEEKRITLSNNYLALQNALFVKMGVLARHMLNVDINDELFTVHSVKGQEILLAKMEAAERAKEPIH